MIPIICQKCRIKKSCSNGEIETCEYLPEPIVAGMVEQTNASMVQSMTRETRKININGEIVEMYKDDLEKQLYKALYSQFEI